MPKKKKLRKQYFDIETSIEDETFDVCCEDEKEIDWEYEYGQDAITQWTETFNAAIYGQLDKGETSI